MCFFRCSCRRREQEPRKFAYLIMKNNSFARFASESFHFWTFGRSSRSFHEVKGPVLQLCEQREHYDKKTFNFSHH